jgi:hypothetical protein
VEQDIRWPSAEVHTVRVFKRGGRDRFVEVAVALKFQLAIVHRNPQSTAELEPDDVVVDPSVRDSTSIG